MVLALKALHVAALIVWCAGLLALALLLTVHDPQHEQSIYARLRRLTHYTYTLLVTPAAVLAIVAGTALLFARAVFEPWMFAKLAVVGVLVALHAWLGLAVSKMGETAGQYEPPSARLALGVALPAMAAALLLVLAKSPLPAGLLPDALEAPRYRSLPLDATPT
jgi:putative membrane protein